MKGIPVLTSAVAAPSATAVRRALRVVAGRRAVRVGLLLGGLLALGLICGQQARASGQPAPGERTVATVDSVREAAQRVTEPVRERVTEPVVAPVREQPAERPAEQPVERPAERTVAQVTEPATEPATGSTGRRVTERVIEPVTESVTEPVVGHVVDTAVRPLADTVGKVARPVGAVVGNVTDRLPAPPGPLPGPDLPVVGTPDRDRPAETAPDAGTHDESGAGSDSDTDPNSDSGTASRSDAHSRQAAAADEHGPRDLNGLYDLRPGSSHAWAYTWASRSADAPDVRRAAASAAVQDGRLPGGPVPMDRTPCGTAVLQSAGDGHSPRGGDVHAVALADAVAFRLASGSGAPVTGTPVRDRHRDILEFPG